MSDMFRAGEPPCPPHQCPKQWHIQWVQDCSQQLVLELRGEGSSDSGPSSPHGPGLSARAGPGVNQQQLPGPAHQQSASSALTRQDVSTIVEQHSDLFTYLQINPSATLSEFASQIQAVEGLLAQPQHQASASSGVLPQQQQRQAPTESVLPPNHIGWETRLTPHLPQPHQQLQQTHTVLPPQHQRQAATGMPVQQDQQLVALPGPTSQSTQQQVYQQLQQQVQQQLQQAQGLPASHARTPWFWDAVTDSIMEAVRTRHGRGNTKPVRDEALSQLLALNLLDRAPVTATLVASHVRSLVQKVDRERKKSGATAQRSAGQASQPQSTSAVAGSAQAAPGAAISAAPTLMELAMETAAAFVQGQQQATQQVLQANNVATPAQRALLEVNMGKEHQDFWRMKLRFLKMFYELAERFPRAHLFISIGSPHGDQLMTWSDARGGGFNDAGILDGLLEAIQTHRKLAAALVRDFGEKACHIERSLIPGKFVKGELSTCAMNVDSQPLICQISTHRKPTCEFTTNTTLSICLLQAIQSVSLPSHVMNSM